MSGGVADMLVLGSAGVAVAGALWWCDWRIAQMRHVIDGHATAAANLAGRLTVVRIERDEALAALAARDALCPLASPERKVGGA